MDGNIASNLSVAGGQAMHSAVGQAAHSQTAAGGHGQQCRLKVEDALSYLESVKLKYESRPQVYNEFLEVMKDFKSQSINTHGVIQRVSQLFQENTDLILGFNTFLPPEYRIEINPNTEAITLHQPSAAGMQQIAITPGNVNRIAANQQPTSTYSGAPNRTAVSGSHSTVSVSSASTAGTEQQTSAASSLQNAHHGVASAIGMPHHPATLHNSMHFGGAQPQSTQVGAQQSGMTHLVAASIQPQAASVGGRAGAAAQPGAGSQQQPVEFDHAISYVNKIKHRFANQPDIYKMFLDILHTYQKEQRALRESGMSAFPPGHRPLSEAEVYQKVAQLFRGQEDLLQEFGQFLPDTNAFALHAAHNVAMITAGANRHDEASLGLHATPASGLQQTALLSSTNHFGVAHNVLEGAAQGATPNLPSGLMPVGRYGVSAPPSAAAAPQRYGGPIGAAYQQPIGVTSQASRGVPAPGATPAQRGLSFLGSVAQSTAGGAEQQIAVGGGAVPDVHGAMRDSVLVLFEQIRGALRPLGAWDDFVRCLKLYNDEVVGRADLLLLVNRTLARHPDLSRQFTEFLDASTKPQTAGTLHSAATFGAAPESDSDESETEEEDEEQDEDEEAEAYSDGGEYPPEDGAIRASGRAPRDRATTSQRQAAVRIDYASLKQCGVSYRALPSHYPRGRCGGRLNAAYAFANDVLNDVWVSLPAWSEGDSQAGSNRKTQFEELLYRLEDERYELDAVIQLNTDTLRLFEYVHAKLNRMSVDERSRFRFTEYLAANEHSSVLYRRAVERLYGDKAHEVIDTLRRAPAVALPVVIARLRQKDEEWREAQRQFNRLWREQQGRYSLRALDVQGATIKQTDLKRIRLRNLLNEIEHAFEEREKARRRDLKTGENADREPAANSKASQTRTSAEADAEPHLALYYAREKRLFDDACGLIIHHVKRQVTYQKEEKSKIKYVVKQVLQEMLFQTPIELSDDEEQQSGDEERDALAACKSESAPGSKLQVKSEATEQLAQSEPGSNRTPDAAAGRPRSSAQTQTEQEASAGESANSRVFYCNMVWYAFLRLHQILCDRLSRIWQQTLTLVEQYEAEERAEANIRAAAQRQSDVGSAQNQQVAAVALRLRAQRSVNPRGFYDTFLELVRSVLDGEIDNQQFEDELRELYTTKAHYAYAVDKIIQNAVRQLQLIVLDEKTYKVLKLFHAERRARTSSSPLRGATSPTQAQPATVAVGATSTDSSTIGCSYQDRVRQLLEDGPCYRVCFIKTDSCEPNDAASGETENPLTRTNREPPNGVKITFELLESPDESESSTSENDDKDDEDATDKDKREDADNSAPTNSKVKREAGADARGGNANGAASSPSDTSARSERGEADEQMDTSTNERSNKSPKRKRKAARTESDSDHDTQQPQAKVRVLGKDETSSKVEPVKRNFHQAALFDADSDSLANAQREHVRRSSRFATLRSWLTFVEHFAFEGLGDATAAAARSRLCTKNKPRLLLRNIRDYVRRHVQDEKEDGDAVYARLAHATTACVLVDQSELPQPATNTNRLILLMRHLRVAGEHAGTSEAKLRRAKRSALHRYNRWSATHFRWLTKNAPAMQSSTDWFLAKYEGEERALKQVKVAYENRPPFHEVIKYVS